MTSLIQPLTIIIIAILLLVLIRKSNSLKIEKARVEDLKRELAYQEFLGAQNYITIVDETGETLQRQAPYSESFIISIDHEHKITLTAGMYRRLTGDNLGLRYFWQISDEDQAQIIKRHLANTSDKRGAA